MLSVLLITLPFFALIVCGFVATWRGILPQAAIPGLNTFVLYFALPCMLYRFAAQTPIHQLLNVNIIAVYLCSAALLVGSVIVLTRKRMGWNDAAFGALVTAFPNTGFMGAPLLAILLGAESAGPVIVTMAIDMVITTSACIALSRLDLSGSQGVWTAVRHSLKGVAANPMPWSIVLGGTVSAMGWGLPAPVDNTIVMLAGAASPVALFTIGAVLARSQMNSNEHVAAVDYVPLAMAKLIVHPLLVWIMGMIVMGLGMPLQHETLVVLVLLAALPSASNVTLLTERYGAHSGRVARVILVSTSLAFLTFSATVALITPL